MQRTARCTLAGKQVGPNKMVPCAPRCHTRAICHTAPTLRRRASGAGRGSRTHELARVCCLPVANGPMSRPSRPPSPLRRTSGASSPASCAAGVTRTSTCGRCTAAGAACRAAALTRTTEGTAGFGARRLCRKGRGRGLARTRSVTTHLHSGGTGRWRPGRAVPAMSVGQIGSLATGGRGTAGAGKVAAG